MSSPDNPEIKYLPREDKCAQIWREAFQSAAAFAGPSPRNGRHRRGDKIFRRMMDLEGEAIQKCDRERESAAAWLS